jgi:receptor expression-enhancing protein 5/6
MLGVIYPTFKSFAAIETKTSKEDDEQWLTYWVVYATLNMLERLMWPVLMWVPFYGVIKCGLLVWLVMPRFLGARLIYTAFVRNMLYVAAEALKEVPALEEVVKPFVDKVGGKGGVSKAAAQSHSVAGGDSEKKDG